MRRRTPTLVKRADLSPIVESGENTTTPIEQPTLLGRMGRGFAHGLQGVGNAGALLAAQGVIGSRIYGPNFAAGLPVKRQSLNRLATNVGLDPARISFAAHPGAGGAGGAAHLPTVGSDGRASHLLLVPPGSQTLNVNLGALSHELGHGRITDVMHRVGGRHAPVAWRGAGNLGVGAAEVASAFAGMGSPTAAWLGTAFMMPKLTDEILASHYGGRALLRTAPPRTFLRGAGRYLSAYAGLPSYLARAATPWAAYGLNRAQDWAYRKLLERMRTREAARNGQETPRETSVAPQAG